ncbi:MAG: trehalose-phosphatase [Candidatus Omnitrophota bacterium]
MKELFSLWDGVIKKALESRYIYLFLDCDGTLAPIAATPGRAAIPKRTRKALVAFSKSEKSRLAIISGRSLSDIKAFVGLDGIIYTGNHGLEIEGPGITSRWKMPGSYKDSLAEIREQLARGLGSMPGIMIEDKGLSLCLHYRMARAGEKKIIDLFRKVTGPYISAGKISVMHGKKSAEVRPATGWNKGKIVGWLLERERLRLGGEDIIAVYVGDDETDEDAFKTLSEGGITVRVGRSSDSSAKYYVDDTDDVYRFLKMILKTRSR